MSLSKPPASGSSCLCVNCFFLQTDLGLTVRVVILRQGPRKLKRFWGNSYPRRLGTAAFTSTFCCNGKQEKDALDKLKFKKLVCELKTRSTWLFYTVAVRLQRCWLPFMMATFCPLLPVDY